MPETEPNYSLAAPGAGTEIPAPELPYRPRDPQHWRAKLAVVGCGGISATHLEAYAKAGYEVVALCDLQLERAEARRKQFCPEADVYTDAAEVFSRADVDVVDLTAHPEQRAPLLEAAIRAGKHVLSQKPFVLDLDFGQRLVDLAEKKGVKLAVNQNGRFAPHFSYLREAVRAGLVGRVMSVHASVHWDHNWIKGLPFDHVRHIILYDFAIHWFDLVSSLLVERQPRRVFASFTRSESQQATPALLGQATIEYDDAQVSLAFDADTRFGTEDRTIVVASEGTIKSIGPTLREQTLTVFTPRGRFSPKLSGCWFPDGFHGTMGDLLTAIETGSDPLCNARDNLQSLSLCFAAVTSAETHRAVVPGKVRKLPEG